MLFLGLALGGVAFVLLSAFPKTQALLAAHKKATVAIILVYFAALILHPYAIGLPGLIGEHSFDRGIRLDMTRDQVLGWALKDGAIVDKSDALLQKQQSWSEFDSGRLDATFIDSMTFCIVGGKTYTLFFSSDWKLIEWHVKPYGNAC